MFDHALRVRRRDFTLPEHPLADPEMADKPGAGRHEQVLRTTDDAAIALHRHSGGHRVVSGSWNDRGRFRCGSGYESSGAGFAESGPHDEAGRLGRSVQSLFVEPR